MEKEILINYAKLIAKHGLNVQKGQDVEKKKKKYHLVDIFFWQAQ